MHVCMSVYVCVFERIMLGVWHIEMTFSPRWKFSICEIIGSLPLLYACSVSPLSLQLNTFHVARCTHILKVNISFSE